MDFKDQIQQISERISKQKDMITTEEATKNAFIMPMITALGYDVFNPFEVVPEMDCDLTKRGDKIDYAIMKDEQPILLIECKHCRQKLDLHNTQLAKYFAASNARFGVLTNGVEYRFYADLEKQNIMDEKPFLIINVLDLSDNDIEQLKKFHKSYYNETEILSTANELKYTTEIKNILSSEFSSPSPEFVKFITRQVYDGAIWQSVIEQFTPIVKKSISSIINDIISDRLNNAIKNEEKQVEQTGINAETTSNEKEIENNELPDGVVSIDKEKGIITTQEEMDAYNIIRSILRQYVDSKRIQYKDYKSYFSINIDNSMWWWICRLSLKPYSKRVNFPLDNYRSNEWIEIESIDDLFKYADKLKSGLDIAINSANYWYEKNKTKNHE